jgi:hypothetical protein
MFKHSLIKHSPVVVLMATAAAFPVAAQAQYAQSAGGSLSASQIPVTGPPAAASVSAARPTDASSDGYQVPSLVVPATSQPASLTDASSGGYRFPSSVVSATTQPGSSFDWGDAGIGAGSMIVLLGAGGLGAATMRRRRTVVG